MDKERVKERLDIIADAVKILAKHKGCICDAQICNKEMQMRKCVRKFAEIMGLELREESWKHGNAAATLISFEYEGVIFFELENYMEGEE